MAQTPALLKNDDGVIDYTPSGADVIAGQVVELGVYPFIAPVAIPDGVKGALAYRGVWKVPQKAEAISAGARVYWDDAGNPVTGDAGSGAATATATANTLLGICTKTSVATDSYVEVILWGTLVSV